MKTYHYLLINWNIPNCKPNLMFMTTYLYPLQNWKISNCISNVMFMNTYQNPLHNWKIPNCKPVDGFSLQHVDMETVIHVDVLIRKLLGHRC